MSNFVPNTVKSPCIRLCKIHVELGSCIGCGRTMAEIAAWGSLGVEAQAKIIRKLPSRLDAINRLGKGDEP
ncbi:DUF1289 domain-containing protein [Aliirhizobium smilacinae]|uniref:DUF1289 domain-containing protein n=1 Tax=Aliirhizobium smilacinae TaxID=1395944 RepID=A0A5C4X951_9HYPH|nr:DUF1289 domain-containing protein [Rhizobium smilacinae]